MNRAWRWKREADTSSLLTIPDMRVPDRLGGRQRKPSSTSAICGMQAVWRWKHLMVLSLLRSLSHRAIPCGLTTLTLILKIIYYSKARCSSFAWKERNMLLLISVPFKTLRSAPEWLTTTIGQHISRNVDNSIRDDLRNMADTPKLIIDVELGIQVLPSISHVVVWSQCVRQKQAFPPELIVTEDIWKKKHKIWFESFLPLLQASTTVSKTGPELTCHENSASKGGSTPSKQSNSEQTCVSSIICCMLC